MKVNAMVPSAFSVMFVIGLFSSLSPDVFLLYSVAAGVVVSVRLPLPEVPGYVSPWCSETEVS